MSAGCKKYFFILINAINLLLAINTANTKFFILEQLLCMALVIVSRTVALNGKIRTEWVKNIKGLLVTEKLKKKETKEKIDKKFTIRLQCKYCYHTFIICSFIAIVCE